MAKRNRFHDADESDHSPSTSRGLPFDSTESLFTDRTAYSGKDGLSPVELPYDQPRRNLSPLRQLPEDGVYGDSTMSRNRIPQCDSQATLPVEECTLRNSGLYDDPLEHGNVDDDYDEWKTDIAKPMAALYALLIIISNIALSVSAQARRDNHIPITYSKWFDAALYGLGILYLLYAMVFLFRVNKPSGAKRGFFSWKPFRLFRRGIANTSDHDFSASHNADYIAFPHPVARTKSSVYLKVNAIICGIGAMIFACLEFGVFISNRRCYEIIVGVIPLMILVFIALQTYFIFLYSKHVICRNVILSRFGLMHLVATDITIWLRVLIDQTLYEFTVYRNQIEKTQNATDEHSGSAGQGHTSLYYRSVDRNLHGPDGFSTLSSPACLHAESVLADVLVNASVFLYPCIIGYAVITAGIVYIMYRNIANREQTEAHFKRRSSDTDERSTALWQQHHLSGRWCSYCNVMSTKGAQTQRLYWLDCDQAVGGLLTGSIVFALTIVCLILFFVFKTRNPELSLLAAQIGETILYCLGIGATIIAFVEAARKLPKNIGCRVSWELDTAMLLISVVGVYAFSILSIIGSNDDTPGIPINTILMIVTQTLAIIQATLQTIYIFEASHRSIAHPSETVSVHHGIHDPGAGKPGKIQKPGRNALTFLIVINISFWNMNIFKTLRSEASPLQREFFGVYEWTIITHVTVPLTLLYRFHSAAGLFEIWKHAYKIKHPINIRNTFPSISAQHNASCSRQPETPNHQIPGHQYSHFGTPPAKGRVQSQSGDPRLPALDLDYSSNWQRMGDVHSASRL